MTERVLLASEHFRISADDEARRVRIVRTAKPFGSRAELESAFKAAAEVTRPFDGCALLLDSRDAPARNDPEFEALFAESRRRLVTRFSPIAVLMKSAIGRLQAARYAREDHVEPHVFEDEATAIAYLERIRSR